MNHQLPPSNPSRRRRHAALLTPWQFLFLSTGVAIAILGGGLVLVKHLSHDLHNRLEQPLAITPIKVSAPEFSLPDDNSALLTTELLPSIAAKNPAPRTQIAVQKIWKYRYNVASLPDWHYSPELQNIVEDIKTLTTAEKLPIPAVSVVLIDLNGGAIAYYQPELTHYPASVAKLFWMVALYGQFEQGLLKESDFQQDLKLMVQSSDTITPPVMWSMPSPAPRSKRKVVPQTTKFGTSNGIN